MATNKNASIRYNVLDNCFRNPGRKYYIESLVNACNDALFEYSGITDGIKKRQIFEDIKFMESQQGWGIPLERFKDGKKVYYRYSDLAFSINNQPINENEARQLKETLSMLSRFKGLPHFEWIDELSIRLESAFGLKGNAAKVIDFEQNLYLKGMEFFSTLFNAIAYRTALLINYKSFRQENALEIIFHPYYLKQYNNRWFVFGLNEELGVISNYALDRVIDAEQISTKFKDNNNVDFTTYFEDCIGVTVAMNAEPQKLQIEVDRSLWPYIETKPIHGSQKIKKVGDSCVIIELNIIINYELVALLFSYGDQIKVVSPKGLSEQLRDKAICMVKKYS